MREAVRKFGWFTADSTENTVYIAYWHVEWVLACDMQVDWSVQGFRSEICASSADPTVYRLGSR